ncbi:MAG: hypothetical protein KIT17_11925 [Rubrivivax sp.]|nr:hypothetical protein [Rubrivivax sp.]
MSFRSIHAPVRGSRTLLAIAFGLAVAACGGGEEEDSAVVSSTSSAAQAQKLAATAAHATQPAVAAASVTVEGCVLDRHYIPTTGTPVRALAADGRLLGNAQSDGQGRFTLRLPARGDVTLQIDRPSGESLPMRVDAAASKWETCLLDDQA